MPLLDWLEKLSVSSGAGILVPAAIFAVSVAFFAYAVFNLSRVMSVRNVLGINLAGLRQRGRPWLLVLYGLAYVVMYGGIFPVLAYPWFCVLVILLAFMYNSKTPDDLLFISVAVLAAVRVTAYHNPDLARDIAKILPFGMLGVFLINLGDFDYGKSITLLEQAATHEQQAFYYWLYLSCQELALRVTQPTITGAYHWTKTRVLEQVDRVRKWWRRRREAVVELLEGVTGEIPEPAEE